MVARFNSIKLAADFLHVVPSTISQALHKMEKEFGITLLLRTYRGIELSPIGKEIAKEAENVFEYIEKIDGIIRNDKNIETDFQPNKIKIYLSRGYYQCGAEILYDKCAEQGILLELSDMSRGNETYLDMVNDEKSSVLLNYFINPWEELLAEYENVSYIKLATGLPCIRCSKDYPLIPLHKKYLTIEETLQLPFLFFSEGYDLALPIYERLEEYGKLNIVGKYSTASVIEALIKRNVGVSVCCNKGFVGNEDHSNMRILPIKCDMHISLLLCYNKTMENNSPMIVDSLVKALI